MVLTWSRFDLEAGENVLFDYVIKVAAVVSLDSPIACELRILAWRGEQFHKLRLALIRALAKLKPDFSGLIFFV
jgi:hypothetical protein